MKFLKRLLLMLTVPYVVARLLISNLGEWIGESWMAIEDLWTMDEPW